MRERENGYVLGLGTGGFSLKGSRLGGLYMKREKNSKEVGCIGWEANGESKPTKQ